MVIINSYKVSINNKEIYIYIDNTINAYGMYYDFHTFNSYGGKIKLNVEACNRDGILDKTIIHEVTHAFLDGYETLDQESICVFVSENIGEILEVSYDILSFTTKCDA